MKHSQLPQTLAELLYKLSEGEKRHVIGRLECEEHV